MAAPSHSQVTALGLVALAGLFGSMPRGSHSHAAPNQLLPPARAHAPARHRALWVWDHGDSALHADAMTRLFDFSASHGIDTLYYESSALIVDDPSALAGFIQASAMRGFSVELLFSSNSWVYPQNHAQAVALVRKAVRFADGLSGARPDAFHFDIEPYLLPEWKSGDEEQIAADYLDLLGAIEASGGHVPIHVDIPFWFCSTPVAWPGRGTVRPLDQALLAIVDGCTVMDYRNSADGPDGIVADGRRTLADAEAAGKPVVIGVETNPVSPSFVTFYPLGAEAVDAQLAIVDDLFTGDPAFAGTAVESYRGYRELGP